MMKGINKQIIEIRCTNDEYFEKALLFVRAEKAGSSRPELLGQAAAAADRMTSHSPRKKRVIRLLAVSAAAAALSIAAVCVMVFR